MVIMGKCYEKMANDKFLSITKSNPNIIEQMTEIWIYFMIHGEDIDFDNN